MTMQNADQGAQAYFSASSGEMPQTAEDLLALVESKPEEAEAARRLAQLMLRQGRLGQIGALLARCVQANPEEHSLLTLAGMAALQNNDNQGAESMFQRAAELAPDNPTYQANLGKCRFIQKDLAGARRPLELALAGATPGAADEIKQLLAVIDSQIPAKAQPAPREQPAMAKKQIPPEKRQPSAWMDDKLAKFLSPPENRREQIQEDAEALRGVRILHAPSEICGNLNRMAKGLRGLGIESRSVNYGYNTWANYQCDYNLDLPKQPPQKQQQLLQELFAKVVDEYDIFHFHYARSLLPNFADLEILRQKGKKILFSFWGSDHRAEECIDYNMARFLGYDPPQPYFLNRAYYGLHKTIDHYSHVLLGGNCIPRGLWVPGVVDADSWDPAEKERMLQEAGYKDPNKLYVVHAPSNPRFKGSGIIMNLLDKCKEQGLPLEVIYVSGMPLAEAKKLYSLADCAIDQLSGVFGGFGIEMMLWQTPILDYISQDFKRLRGNPPIIQITADTFMAEIENCWRMKQSGELAEQGRACREWTIENVDFTRNALPVYTAMYRKLMAKESIPQYINLDWREQDRQMARGEKRDFHRYMREHDIYAQIGIDPPAKDDQLYE